MTSYRIEHRTTYTYDSDVTGSYGVFHLRPAIWRGRAAWPMRSRSSLSRRTCSGTLTSMATQGLLPRHRATPGWSSRRSAWSTSVGTILDPEALAVPWEWTQPRLRDDDGEAWEAMDFTFPSPYVDVLRRSRTTPGSPSRLGRPIGEAAVELMHRIHQTSRTIGSTTAHQDLRAPREADRGVPGLRTFHGVLPSLAGPRRALCQRLSGYSTASREAAADWCGC